MITLPAKYTLLAQLTEPGSALDAARTLADTIAANAPLAVRGSKRIIAEVTGRIPAAQYEEQDAIARGVNRSADAREGILAFTQKRAPQWEGR